MAIDTSNNVKPGNPLTSRSNGSAAASGRSDTTARGKESASGTSPDSVSLSAEAQTMHKLESAIQSASDIDSEKVDAIKQAIAEGRFEINADRLAEAMLAQDELLN